MRQQGRRKANGAEDVRGHNRFRLRQAGGRGPEVLGSGDACVMTTTLRAGWWSVISAAKARDSGGIGDIERGGRHARIGTGHFLQGLLTPAGDNDFVAERMKGFRQAAADA